MALTVASFDPPTRQDQDVLGGPFNEATMTDERLTYNATANYMAVVHALHTGETTFKDVADGMIEPLDMGLVEKVERQLNVESFEVDDHRLMVCAWLGHCFLHNQDPTCHVTIRKAVAAILSAEIGRDVDWRWGQNVEADDYEIVFA